MSASRRREIACAVLLDTFGRFLLQQRDNKPEIVHPGKISLFGGHREDSESYLQCVVREIYEEISYFVPPGQFEYLASYEAIDDDQNGAVVHAEFFVARELPAEDLMITEGSAVFVKQQDLAAVEPGFTPSTRYAIRAFLNRKASDKRR
jgi:8-oxo-dGTP pyrophosphatase MutT (NUDIX family)